MPAQSTRMRRNSQNRWRKFKMATVIKTTKTTKAPKAKEEFWATGRRKTSIARVILIPGSGKMQINSKPMETYFGRAALQFVVNKPFEETGTKGQYDLQANLEGGGIAAQATALQHGIARALLIMNPELRKPLKSFGLLTRDPREKERCKVGCRKARRRPQYSKR